MKLGIGSDFAGFALKAEIKEWLESLGHTVTDYGCYNEDVCDYPLYGAAVGLGVAKEEVELGILICGTGIGISLAANTVPGVRAAVVSDVYSAKMSRVHNNANILAFGARVVGRELAKMMIAEWLNAEFSGGVQVKRLAMLSAFEKGDFSLVPPRQ